MRLLRVLRHSWKLVLVSFVSLDAIWRYGWPTYELWVFLGLLALACSLAHRVVIPLGRG